MPQHPTQIDTEFEKNKAELERIRATEDPLGEVFPIISSEDAAKTVRDADDTLKGLEGTNEKARAESLGIDTSVSGWLDRLREAEGEKDGDGLEQIFADDEQQKAREEIDVAVTEKERRQKEVDDLRSEIDSFRITDADLNAQIASITGRLDARIDLMEDINERREQAFQTLGFRTGAQFSGGIRGGVFGGVIAEEERQGILRIGVLEAQKATEIAGAKSAAKQFNWNLYVEKVNAAQDAADRQVLEVEKLNKAFIRHLWLTTHQTRQL